MLKSEIQSHKVSFYQKLILFLSLALCMGTSKLWAEADPKVPEQSSWYDETGHLFRGESSEALAVEQVEEDSSKLKFTFRKPSVVPQCQALADRGIIKAADLQPGPPDKFRFAGELIHENNGVIQSRMMDAHVSLDPVMLNSCLAGLQTGASGMVGVLIKEPKTAVTEGLELRQKIYEGSLKACDNIHDKKVKNLSGEEMNLAEMCKEIVKYGFASVLQSPEVTGNLILTEFSLKTATSLINFFRGLSRGGKGKKVQKFVTQFMQNVGYKVQGFECVTAEAQTRAVCEGLSAAVVLGGSVVLGSLAGICEEECPAEILAIFGRAESAGEAAAAASLASKVQKVEKTSLLIAKNTAGREFAAVAKAREIKITNLSRTPQTTRPSVPLKPTIVAKAPIAAASRGPASISDLHQIETQAVSFGKEAEHMLSIFKDIGEYLSQGETGSTLTAKAKLRSHMMAAGMQSQNARSVVPSREIAKEKSYWQQITSAIDLSASQLRQATLSKDQLSLAGPARQRLFLALIQGFQHVFRTRNETELESLQLKFAQMSSEDRKLFARTQLSPFLMQMERSVSVKNESCATFGGGPCGG